MQNQCIASLLDGWSIAVDPCIAYKGHAEEEIRNAYKNRDSDSSSEGRASRRDLRTGKKRAVGKRNQRKPGLVRTAG